VSSPPFRPRPDGQRIVICDYNALLLSVTGLLRMAGYCVFQAHDGYAADELCLELPDISLLILNTDGTGVDVGQLIRKVRKHVPGLPVLHIGSTSPPELPADVPTIDERFSPDALLTAVAALVKDRSGLVDTH
jgi:DNA-binding NtrC family response regulator